MNDIQKQIKLDEHLPYVEKFNQSSEVNNNHQTFQNQDYIDNNDVSELDSSDDPGN